MNLAKRNSSIYFFTTVGMQNVHRDNAHDMRSFRKYQKHQNETNLYIYLIDNNATAHMIKGIKMSQSKGHDGISSELKKLFNSDIQQHYRHNQSTANLRNLS